jgi:DNA-binding MarR family transcriptional regulator
MNTNAAEIQRTDAALHDVAERMAVIVGRYTRLLQSARGGLSHGQLTALASVTKHGPLRLAELAQIESVSAPATTRTVAELEARGLVQRRADPDDGRAALIEVTSEGAAAIVLARSARTEVVASLLSTLTDGELERVRVALPALERVLEQP